jgi:hypothetical protein
MENVLMWRSLMWQSEQTIISSAIQFQAYRAAAARQQKWKLKQSAEPALGGVATQGRKARDDRLALTAPLAGRPSPTKTR